MNLTLSMFATPADYWKARAELAEQTLHEVAKELGCECDNEEMLQAIYNLKFPFPSGGDGTGGLTQCDMHEDESY